MDGIDLEELIFTAEALSRRGIETVVPMMHPFRSSRSMHCIMK